MKDFFRKLFAPKAALTPPKPERRGFFTTDVEMNTPRGVDREELYDKVFQKQVSPTKAAFAMDAQLNGGQLKATMDSVVGVKSQFVQNTTVPGNLLSWYGSQSFIGFPVCAMISQQWLVMKACTMPAEDAVRKGYEVTVNNGEKLEPKILDAIRQQDIEYQVAKNMVEFTQMGRVFGIRIAMFIIKVDNPKEFYTNPFNPDGIPPNSYQGISQIDPYWITPQLDSAAAGDPGSIHFYEPTWWYVAGMMVHRTHLIIYRNEELPDILKPTYIYGSVSIPQKIYERVYAAERTANEAPMLAMTKRLNVLKTDSTKALANQSKFEERLRQFSIWMNNYGVKTIDSQDEDMVQFDTTLSDLDNVIMTQYQLVAAIANVPATKLLGTAPKGFNSTGEFEEASYHEFLESVQEKVKPLVERHHLILMRSNIAPEFNMSPIDTSIRWNELDAMTEKEQAEVNKLKADTGAQLAMMGAIDGEDERMRIIADPDSGYTGITPEVPEQPEDEEPSEGEQETFNT